MSRHSKDVDLELLSTSNFIITNASTGVQTTVDMTELAALNNISATELGYIDGVTAGTALASKAVVLGASKDIATITSATITTLTSTTGNVTTVNATNIDAGASGTAGSVDVFPANASKGKATITCTDQTGDTAVSVVVGAMGAARTITLRDPGAAASILTTTDATAAATTATAVEISRTCDVSSRVVNATASTLTVTEADHDGKTIVLDLAAGIAVTLPAAAAGLKFRFVVKTTFTGAASIKSVSGADIMIGHALMGNDTNDTVVDFQSLAASTNDTIDLFGTANSTGGIAGQVITIEGLAANLWYVEIRGDAAGTEATPFANTVA
jgi:hypothetical protein